MKIIRHSWRWAYPLSRRIGKPRFCNWHHAAAKRLSPRALHALHLTLGWCGFGYNFYIRKNGRIFVGRAIQFCGGGAKGDWSSVGVCCEGNYDVEKKMPPKQLASAQWLHDYLDEKFDDLKHRPHKAVPDNATACPGRYFPLAEILAGVPAQPRIELTDKNISVPRQYRGHQRKWWRRELVPFIEQVRAQGDGKRVDTRGDPLIIPEPAEKPKWWRNLMKWKKKNRTVEPTAVVPDEVTPEPEHPVPDPVPTVRKRSPWFWRFKR